MWNTIQCAVQGRGHVKSNIPCQDKTYFLSEKGTQVIALADGAGSAALSHIGAEYVSRTICENLTDNFDSYFQENDGVAIKRKIINDLVTGLKRVATENDCSIKDLASTLLMVAIKEDKYIIIHIGDGVIGYLKNGQLKIASHPENGEFVNTTVFVTSADVLVTMKILKGSLGNIDGFVLMSDGTESSFYNKKDKTLAPILKNLMEYTRILNVHCLESEIYKGFEDVIKSNTTDDCSMILMVKDDNSFIGYNKLSIKEKENMLFGLTRHKGKKKIRKYDIILNFSLTPRSLMEISKKLYIKTKYAKKHLQYLQEKHFVVKEEEQYRTALILDK